jgi:hypothetical protein
MQGDAEQPSLGGVVHREVEDGRLNDTVDDR